MEAQIDNQFSLVVFLSSSVPRKMEIAVSPMLVKLVDACLRASKDRESS